MNHGRACKFLSVTILSLTLLSCGGSNYFKDASVKDSNEALFEDGQKLVDEQRYTEAIAKFLSTSSSFQTSYEFRRALAGAYAGRCGLNLLQFSSQIQGSGAPFSTFMSGFTSATVAPADCYLAQQVLENAYGATAALRTAALGSSQGNSVNFFMAILGMSKIGSRLRDKADPTQSGSVAGGFDACSSGSISDAEVKEIGTGFALILDNFATISATLGGSSAIGSVNTACAGITPNPCIITDPTSASWDAAAVMVFRSLIKSNTIGIQSCSADNAGNPLPFPFDCCP